MSTPLMSPASKRPRITGLQLFPRRLLVPSQKKNDDDQYSFSTRPKSFKNVVRSDAQSEASPKGKVDDVSQLTKDLNKLSVSERNQVYEEVHGVAEVIQETPQMVNRCIDDMKAFINSKKKLAKGFERKDLERAFFLRPALYNDTRFFLLFLRARRFQIQQSVECMCAYFTNKRELFGMGLLVETITLDKLLQLDPDILKLFEEGTIQVLQHRESTGRSLIILQMDAFPKYDILALKRYNWYQYMSAIQQDEELQKRGVILVASIHDPSVSMSSINQMMREMSPLIQTWPLYKNALHLCSDRTMLNIFVMGIQGMLTSHQRVRQRFHFGSLLESKHMIMSFGIDIHDCFEIGVGLQSLDSNLSYLNDRRTIEAKMELEDQRKNSKTNIVSNPQTEDILMGRRYFAVVNEWQGNTKMAHIVENYVPRYAAIDPKDIFTKRQ